MKILGIETSCDETSAAVVENGTKILSNIIATSSDMHAKTGGIIPEMAAREQLKSIIPVVDEALKVSGQTPQTIDAIAVTVGPGLIGSLLVGVETAKTLAYLWKKPLIPVNHLLGHIYANFLKDADTPTPEFPILSLIVSGGHTDLVLMKSHKNIKWIGGTRDDAAGEAFDKTARILGLSYPGGPAISRLSEEYRSLNPNTKLDLFPRPMINDKSYDFSFSGLKTSVYNYVKNTRLNTKVVQKLSAEVEEAIVDVLFAKTTTAIKEFNPKSFLLGGGVAANKKLRDRFHSGNFMSDRLHVPSAKLCTDNAAPIASYAFFNFHPKNIFNIDPLPELTISSKMI